MKPLQAPIEIEIKLAITNGSGSDGVVTIGMAPGKYPSEQDMRDAVAKFEREQMPDGFRLQNKREWFNGMFGQCQEIDDDGTPVFVNYAMPGGPDWSRVARGQPDAQAQANAGDF